MATPDSSLQLPRILCLHGGGVNSEIFRLQCRGIIASLSHEFRLVFADGPFLCDAGPGILPVYADFGPYRRWLRWLSNHSDVDAEGAVHEIWWQIRDAMVNDDKEGASGPWIGLLGFSQGAKLAASMLLEQQTRKRLHLADTADIGPPKDTEWKFAVLLAGRAPLASLRPETDKMETLVTAADISEGFRFGDKQADGSEEYVIKIPTLHVHGLLDEGIHLHRRLLKQYCAPGTTTLVEWEGTHRVPFKRVDVEKVTSAIREIAARTGT
jgi:pimeloyl-ACP methyl ester carboxylesterase